MRTDVFVSGQDGYHTYRIPALVRAANGDLLAMCEGRRDSERDDGKIDLVLKRSWDGGRTWGELELVYGEPGATTIGNPVPIVAFDGVAHLVFSRNNRQVLYARSDDQGQTWSTPREIGEFARCGPGPGHGLQLRSGRLLVPLWIKEGKTHDYREGTFTATVLLSDNDGAIWRRGGESAVGANESAVAELEDGTLLLNSRYMGQPAGHRMVARSRDGGETFVEPGVDETLIDPNCQGSTVMVGDKLLFSNPAVRNPEVSYRGDLRRELTVRVSRDGGRTWPEARVIDHGPSGYSDLCAEGVLYECGERDYRERIAFARWGLK
jgi:sialidase-1